MFENYLDKFIELTFFFIDLVVYKIFIYFMTINLKKIKFLNNLLNSKNKSNINLKMINKFSNPVFEKFD